MAPLIDRRLPAPQQVYDLMRERIETSQFAPGEQVNERMLAEWLNVSRTPIREAIRQLVGDGLIEIIPNVGTRIAPVDPARVMECCFIRMNLEVAAIENAALYFDAATDRTLGHLIDEQEYTIGTADMVRNIAIDSEFHRVILRLSRYPIIEEILQKVMGEVLRARHLSIKLPGRLHEPIAEHRKILAALRSGDPADCARQMRFHLNESYRSIQRALKVTSP